MLESIQNLQKKNGKWQFERENSSSPKGVGTSVFLIAITENKLLVLRIKSTKFRLWEKIDLDTNFSLIPGEQINHHFRSYIFFPL